MNSGKAKDSDKANLNTHSDIKIAFVMDEMLRDGGGAHFLEALIEVYPNAPVYTSRSDKLFVKKHFPNTKIVNSFIQYIPFGKYLKWELLLLYPWAYRFFNFNDYDVVLSISNAFAKYVKPNPKKTKHIYYCFTPAKFFWMQEGRSNKDMAKWSYKFYNFFRGSILERIWQYWDRKAAQSADRIVSLSNVVSKRIKKFYKSDSIVIYPPVEIEEIKVNEDISSREDWFLYFGRIETYKGVELAIRAAIRAGTPMKFSGLGMHLEDMKKLIAEIDHNGLIEFLGYVDDDEKYELMRKCKALLFPVKDEDFGIVPIEGNAAGAPVIAYRSGGVVETISEEDPKSGIFFNEYTEESLSAVLKNFDSNSFSPLDCRKQSEQFSKKIFQTNIKRYINEVYQGKA